MSQLDIEADFYDAIYTVLEDAAWTKDGPGASVYIPPVTPYLPDVYIERTQIITSGSTKDRLNARGIAIISAWGKQEERGDVSNLASKIYRELAKLTKTRAGYQLDFAPSRSNIEIMSDTSTPETLWRARLRVEWLIS